MPRVCILVLILLYHSPCIRNHHCKLVYCNTLWMVPAFCLFFSESSLQMNRVSPAKSNNKYILY
ncbi:hypothetical protein OIU74_020653, partial [Salix koriyanagi]